MVVSHFRENLSWINNVDMEKYSVMVVSKTLPTATIMQPENIGDEATAYMEYIIHFYDELPPYVVFVHGHEHSYHHVGSIVDIVNCMRFTKPYHNFNGNPTDDQFYCTLVDEGTPQEQFGFWKRNSDCFFAPIGGLAPIGPSTTFRFRMSGQFVVDRDQIRRYTRAQWSEMLRILYDACRDPSVNQRRECGKTYEFSWCALFTGETDEKQWNDRCP